MHIFTPTSDIQQVFIKPNLRVYNIQILSLWMPTKCTKHVYIPRKTSFSTPNIQPWLPRSHDSFVRAEKRHLYLKPQMEICATVCTKWAFATFKRVVYSSSLTLTWQQALSGRVNQVKLPLQPIVVKDLISKKKCSTLTAYQSLSSSSTPGGTWSIRCCCSLTDRTLTKEMQRKLLQCKSFSENEKHSYLPNDNPRLIHKNTRILNQSQGQFESHALHLGSLKVNKTNRSPVQSHR